MLSPRLSYFASIQHYQLIKIQDRLEALEMDI
jgi:hypothetical protein